MNRPRCILLAATLLALGACKRSKPAAEETPDPTPAPFSCSRASLARLEPKAGALLSRAAIPAPPAEEPSLDRRVVTCLTSETGPECAERALADANATAPEGASVSFVGEMPAPEEKRDTVTVLVTGAVEEPEAPHGERWTWFPDDKDEDPEVAAKTLSDELAPLEVDVAYVSRGGPGSILVDVVCRNPPPEEEPAAVEEPAPVEEPPAEATEAPEATEATEAAPEPSPGP